MLLGDDQRFWDVRYTRPVITRVKKRHDSEEIIEYQCQKNGLVCVAATSILAAITATVAQWPDATIWSVVNHGRECGIIVSE